MNDIEQLLRELVNTQDTVTDRNIRLSLRDYFFKFDQEQRAFLRVEMDTAAERREKVRRLILDRFGSLRWQRDQLLALARELLRAKELGGSDDEEDFELSQDLEQAAYDDLKPLVRSILKEKHENVG